jgi:hypothetical protein
MTDSHTCIRTISLILSGLVVFERSGTSDWLLNQTRLGTFRVIWPQTEDLS